MDKLIPTRCMVSPNGVEETKVWTGYSNIGSKHCSSPMSVKYMKNKKCFVRELFRSKVWFHKKSQLMWTTCFTDITSVMPLTPLFSFIWLWA